MRILSEIQDSKKGIALFVCMRLKINFIKNNVMKKVFVLLALGLIMVSCGEAPESAEEKAKREKSEKAKEEAKKNLDAYENEAKEHKEETQRKLDSIDFEIAKQNAKDGL